MSPENWLPATARASAVDRKMKAGETLFRRGSKTIGLYEVISGRVRLVRIDRVKLFCMSQAQEKRSQRRRCSPLSIIVMR
jgi:hypothetical protein